MGVCISILVVILAVKPVKQEITSFRVSMETHVSVEALKEEYFTPSTSYDYIIAELADFYRKNKQNISEKLQLLEGELIALRNELRGEATFVGKNTGLIVELGGKLRALEKRVEELEEK